MNRMNKNVVALPAIFMIVIISFDTAWTTNKIAMNLAQLQIIVASIRRLYTSLFLGFNMAS